jgi:hypothetical protein
LEFTIEMASAPLSLVTRGGLAFAAVEELDLSTGQAMYDVTGSRVRGVVVLEPAADDYTGSLVVERVYDGARDVPAAYMTNVRVQFGRGIDVPFTEPTDALAVNRVTLYGGFVFDPATARARHLAGLWGIGAYIKRRGLGMYKSVPGNTSDKGADVVMALVEHWIGIPERPQLIAAYLRRFSAEWAARLPSGRRTI